MPRLVCEREGAAWVRVSLCACVNYTCTASALSAAASKRNNFFSTVDHVDCRMLGRTSLQHGMVFHEDADPKMIGHQRSSTHGPALSPYRRTFSTSKKVWHNVPRRSHSAHPRQGNHTDARQTQAPSLKKVPKKFQHTLHGEAKASAYLSTVTKSRTIVEKSKFSPCGPKSGREARHETNCPW